jgi:hypothetical protein
MQQMDAIFYTSELQYAPDDIGPFLNWFAGRHSADLFRAGFYTTTCYRAVEGGLTIVDIYQAPTWDVFTGEGYKVRDKDPYAKQMLAPRTANVNSVYSYHNLTAAGDPRRKIDADWVALTRFAADEATEAAIGRWLDTTEVARLMALGAASVRLVHRSKDRPGSASYRPRCALLTEWSERPPPADTHIGPLVAQLGHPLVEGDAFVGYRLYPWPDNVDLMRQSTASRV